MEGVIIGVHRCELNLENQKRPQMSPQMACGGSYRRETGSSLNDQRGAMPSRGVMKDVGDGSQTPERILGPAAYS